MTELYHFGIKGQRWGVRRFQSPDGTLTAAGKARYKAYKKDFKDYDKLNRHVSAAQRHLKEEGVMLDRVRDKYLKENKNYEKAMRKSSGLFGLKGAEKAEKVANAQKTMDDASSEYEKAAGAYGVAKKIATQDASALRRHVDKMIRDYGKGSINEIQTKTVKIGQNKLQKLMQGAPTSIVFNQGRETEQFIKTGKTLADMPIIGGLYTANYVAKREAELERAKVENSVRGAKRQLGGKKGAKYLNPGYFKGVSSLSSEDKEEYAKQQKEEAKAKKEAAKAKKEEAKAKKEAAKAKKEAAKAEKLANREKASKYADDTRKAIDDARANAESSKRNANRDRKSEIQKEAIRNRKQWLKEQDRKSGNTIGQKVAGAAIRVAGTAAASAAAAAAGPIAGYAARTAIKNHRKRKRKEAWNSFWGIKHSACSYRVVRSDELYHHGIKGQRWGVRRYQNPDGTLTEKGKKRKEKLYAKAEKEYERGINSKYQNRIDPHNSEFQKKLLALKKKEIDEGFNYLENRVKRNAMVGAVIGSIPGAAIATAYTAVRYNKQNLDRERLKSNERKLEDLRQETFRQLNNIQRQIDIQNQIDLQNRINQNQVDLQNQINQMQFMSMNHF